MNTVPVVSAQDMFKAVTERSAAQDIIIKAAAVADYTPVERADQKVKKKEGDLSIPLKRTQDILAWLGEHPEGGDSSSAAFPWRQSICWKTPAPSLPRSMWT